MHDRVMCCRRRCVPSWAFALLALSLGLWSGAVTGARVATSAVLPAPAPGPLPAGAPGPAPAPGIRFNATTFRTGDTVSVAFAAPVWGRDAESGRTDMVALFLADWSDPRLSLPIKYKWAATAEGYLSNGTGSHTCAACRCATPAHPLALLALTKCSYVKVRLRVFMADSD